MEELHISDEQYRADEESVDNMSSHVKLDKQDVDATATRVDAPTRHFESVPVSYSFAFPVLISCQPDICSDTILTSSSPAELSPWGGGE